VRFSVFFHEDGVRSVKAAARTKVRGAPAAASRDFSRLVGYQLRRVGALVSKQAAAIFETIDLAPGQFSILALIADHPDCSQSNLAELARINKATLTPVIERLQALQYIARAPNEKDRRAYRLSVTARGRQAIARVSPKLAAFEQLITADLAADQIDNILFALRSVEAAIGARA